MTTVSAIKCPNCGTIMFSRARHDFRKCGCEYQTHIDGGFDYVKMGGKVLVGTFEMQVDATRTELFDDWNLNIDRWGLIEP